MTDTSASQRRATVTTGEPQGAVVLELHGNIDRAATGELTAAYDQQLGSWPGAERPRVVLDFSDADFINSSGIALVVSILARARAEGRSVAATGLSEHYRHIFDITRLSDFIEVCPDLATAVGSPGQVRVTRRGGVRPRTARSRHSGHRSDDRTTGTTGADVGLEGDT